MSLVSSTVSSTGRELMQKVVHNLPCSDQVVRQYQGLKAERRSYFQFLLELVGAIATLSTKGTD